MMNNINTKRVRFLKPNTFITVRIGMEKTNVYKIKKRCLSGTAFETFAFSLPKVKTNILTRLYLQTACVERKPSIRTGNAKIQINYKRTKYYAK